MTSITRIMILVGFALFTLTVAACANRSRDQKKHAASGSSAMEMAEDPGTGSNFSLRDGNGTSISLKDLRGKVVFINFWATWCPPCIEEMPSIHSLRQKFRDDDRIVFLMVDVDGNYKKAKAFMDKHQYDLPVYIPISDIPADFLGKAIPTTVVLSKKGVMAARVEGGNDYSAPEIVTALQEIIDTREE